MNPEETLNKVIDIICDTLFIERQTIQMDTLFLEIEGWDSLSCTTVLLSLEKYFQIRIPMDRVYSLENIGDLVNLLFELMQ